MRKPWMIAGLVALGLAAVLGILIASHFTGLFQDDIPPAPSAAVDYALALEVEGLSNPVWAEERAEGLFVAEQAGRILRIVDGDAVPWLDIKDRVRGGGERGLLGVAFDTGGRVYVHYSDAEGDTVLSRFSIGPTADAASEEILLQVSQPYSNHNGGAIRFGPDGYLYLGLGDGGLAGDPDENGQDPDKLLGSILRLDVSGDAEYAIPPDNPFADGEGGAPEVWAYGVRNPWRMHFDADGDLWVADVGQNNIEEVTRIPAGTHGANLGWDHWEGSQPYGTRLSRTDHLEPTAEYDHDGGHCSITGGPVVGGVVFIGDYCSGRIWTLTPDGTEDWAFEQALRTDLRISSFGEALEGALVVDHRGAVYRLTPAP